MLHVLQLRNVSIRWWWCWWSFVGEIRFHPLLLQLRLRLILCRRQMLQYRRVVGLMIGVWIALRRLHIAGTTNRRNNGCYCFFRSVVDGCRRSQMLHYCCCGLLLLIPCWLWLLFRRCWMIIVVLFVRTQAANLELLAGAQHLGQDVHGQAHFATVHVLQEHAERSMADAEERHQNRYGARVLGANLVEHALKVLDGVVG